MMGVIEWWLSGGDVDVDGDHGGDVDGDGGDDGSWVVVMAMVVMVMMVVTFACVRVHLLAHGGGVERDVLSQLPNGRAVVEDAATRTRCIACSH